MTGLDSTARLRATHGKIAAILAAITDKRYDDVRILIDHLYATETREVIGQLGLLVVHLAEAGGITSDQLRALLSGMALRLALDEPRSDGSP